MISFFLPMQSVNLDSLLFTPTLPLIPIYQQLSRRDSFLSLAEYTKFAIVIVLFDSFTERSERAYTHELLAMQVV